MDLTKNELQFMTVLWNADAPLTSAEILKRSVNKDWKDTSLHTILNKLLKKGAIVEYGYRKDYKAVSRTFVPMLTCEDYYEAFFAEHLVKDVPQIFSALVNRADLNHEIINQLKGVIWDLCEGADI